MKSESKGLEIWKERRIKKRKKNSLLSRLIGNLRLKKKKKEKQVENGEKGVAVSIT